MGQTQIQQQPVNRAREHNARQKAATVYRLWLRGYTYARIAREVGYSDESGVRKALLRAKRDQAQPPDLELERQRERERLEIAYAGIAERVEEGDVYAIDRAIALAARKAALLGLDAAKQPTEEPNVYTVVQEVYPVAWVEALAALTPVAPAAGAPAATAAMTAEGAGSVS